MPNILENVLNLVKENSFVRVKVSCSTRLSAFMKEIGIRTKGMVEVMRGTQMAIFIMENL